MEVGKEVLSGREGFGHARIQVLFDDPEQDLMLESEADRKEGQTGGLQKKALGGV